MENRVLRLRFARWKSTSTGFWTAVFLVFRLAAQIGPLDHPYLDPGFKAAISGSVHAATDQPDGKILIAGSFTNVNGVAMNGLARLNRSGSLDATFNPPSLDTGGRGIVTLATDNTGRILVGGSFNTVNGVARTNLARLLADGTLDATFVPAPLPGEFGQPPAWPYPADIPPPKSVFSALACLADGRIMAGWTTNQPVSFDTKGILSESLRLREDGTLDETYVRPPVSPLVPRDSLGRPYRINSVGLGANLTLYRVKPTGEVEATLSKLEYIGGDIFGNPDNARSYDVFQGMAFQCIDRMLWFRLEKPLTPDNVFHYRLRRAKLDGATDPAFPIVELNEPPQVLVPLRDGSVFVGGAMARLSYSAVANSTVTNPVSRAMIFLPYPAARNTTIQSGGAVVLTTSLTNGPYQWQFQGTNLPGQTNRSLTLTAAQETDAGLYSLVNPEPAGLCQTFSLPQFVLTVTNALSAPPIVGGVDLAFDPRTGPGTNGVVRSVALAADGRVLVGGSYTQFAAIPAGGLMRLYPDGNVDNSFNAPTAVSGTNTASINQIGFKPDGRIVVAGDFASYGGVARPGLAVLQADGTLDGSFNPAEYSYNPDNWVLVTNRLSGKLHVTANGVILVTKPDLVGGMSLARFNEATKRIFTIMPFLKFGVTGPISTSYFYPGFVQAFATTPDNGVIVAGDFAGQRHDDNGISLVNDAFKLGGTNFTLSTVYGTRGTSDVVPSGLPFRPVAVAFQPDGTLLVAGKGGLVRVRAGGAIDTAFSGLGSDRTNFTQVALAPEGKIIVAGEFETIDNQPRNRIARLNANGTLDTTFDPGSGPNGPIHALVVQPDGNILIGGAFTEVNGIPRAGVARLVGGIPPLRLTATWASGASFQINVPTAAGVSYALEYASTVPSDNWTVMQNFNGDGGVRVLVDQAPIQGRRFYRVRIKP